MRVSFTPADETRGQSGQFGWEQLTIGTEYVVLEVYLRSSRATSYRVMASDKEGPALFDASSFSVVSTKIPKTWGIYPAGKNGFTLSPAPWRRDGFWEAYYDRVLEAERVFEEEKRKIVIDS